MTLLLYDIKVEFLSEDNFLYYFVGTSLKEMHNLYKEATMFKDSNIGGKHFLLFFFPFFYSDATN